MHATTNETLNGDVYRAAGSGWDGKVSETPARPGRILIQTVSTQFQLRRFHLTFQLHLHSHEIKKLAMCFFNAFRR